MADKDVGALLLLDVASSLGALPSETAPGTCFGIVRRQRRRSASKRLRPRCYS
jgi:hypothetical protein